MMTHDLSRWIVRRRVTVAAALAVALLGVLPSPALAQSAEVRYEQALARETAARSSRSASLDVFRSIATAYEIIVRRYPRSGYCDNALWQAAGLLQLAYERGGESRDRAKAREYLAWLRREYPSSSLIAQIPARLAVLSSSPSARPDQARAATPNAPTTSGAAGGAGRLDGTSVEAPEPVPSGGWPTPAAFPSASATVETATQAAERAGTPALPRAAAAGTSRAAPSATGTLAVVRSIAYTRLPKGDRIILELSQEVPFVAARASDQLVLEFAGVTSGEPVRAAAATLEGRLVSGLSLTEANGTSQLTLRLDAGPRYSTFPLYGPYRLVIDVEETTMPAGPAPAPVGPTAAQADRSPAPPATSAAGPAVDPITGPEPPASTSRGDYSLARQLGLGVSRIVIDPGHGGHDPGAQANSVSEAELVLDISLRLSKLLEAQPGFEVVLTRRTDEFVALEERTAIANREGADLFLSIHANSSPNHDTRGIETFFLNFAENASAEAVAARENASSAQAMHVLPELVKAIATHDKVAESRELATIVQASLMRRVGALSKTIKDLGVKQAPFVVLIGAEMPSVLAEVSFLTNKTEAALLKQAAHRQRIAQALCDAILRYQASLKTAPRIATRSEGL